MTFTHEDGRVCLKNEDGDMIAGVVLKETNEIIDITHTFVDPSLRGQGIADKLMLEAYNYIKEKNKKAKLSCSYAVKWYEKNADRRDVL